MNQSGFAQKLKLLRKREGLTLEELANRINNKYRTSFNKSMISKWENGYVAHLSSIQYLSLYFDVSLDEMLGFDVETTENENDQHFKIPIVEDITDEKPILSEDTITGYAQIPTIPKIRPEILKNSFYFKVKGSSMDRIYPVGSYVLVRKNFYVQDGDHALVLVDGDNEAILTKIKVDDHYLSLFPVSNSEKHSPKIIDTNKQGIDIIGKVIGHLEDLHIVN